MLNLRKTPLLFSAIIIVISFFYSPFSPRCYASDVFEESEENQRRALLQFPQAVSGYESLRLPVSDSEDEDLDQSLTSVQRVVQNDEKYYECCLGYYRTIPCWTDAVVTLSLGASAIIFPIMTCLPIDESTRFTIGTIGSCFAFSGLMAKIYRWCILASVRES